MPNAYQRRVRSHHMEVNESFRDRYDPHCQVLRQSTWNDRVVISEQLLSSRITDRTFTTPSPTDSKQQDTDP